MKIKLILFIGLSIIATNHIFSTTIKVDTLILFKQKKITFLSDNHNESPAEKEQTNCLLDFFQQCKDSNISLHILIEQASKLFTSSEFSIVFKLDEHIKKAPLPLDNITLQNIEIRYPAIIACWLLSSYTPNLEARTNYVIDNSTITVGSLTFQDILDNVDTVKQALADYYLNHDNQTIISIYKRHIVYSDEYYDSFKQTINQLHSKYTSVLRYAAHKWKKNSSNKCKFTPKIQTIFDPLLDLHILQNILQSPHENTLVFAGRNHTRDIISMLYDLQVTSIYRSQEYANNQPSTTLEITQGLLAEQPRSLMETCTVQ